jgi:hypothetical protein
MDQPANPTTTDGAASLLVAALEHTWQAIRGRHPRCPRRCWWSLPAPKASG